MSENAPSHDETYVLLSDLASDLKIPAYRLRSWEVLYPCIHSIRDAEGRHFYDARTVGIFKEIARLLYHEGRKSNEILGLLSRQFAESKEPEKIVQAAEEAEKIAEPKMPLPAVSEEKKDRKEKEVEDLPLPDLQPKHAADERREEQQLTVTDLQKRVDRLSEENLFLKDGLKDLVHSLRKFGKSIAS